MSGFSLAEYFDRQEMRNVRAKIDLAGHLDRRPSRRYFALWLQAPKIAARRAYLGKFDIYVGRPIGSPLKVMILH